MNDFKSIRPSSQAATISGPFTLEELQTALYYGQSGMRPDVIRHKIDEILFNPLLQQFGTDLDTFLRYKKLQRKVYGRGSAKALFVVLDPANKDHQELERLTPAILKLNAHLVSHRNQDTEKAFIEKYYA